MSAFLSESDRLLILYAEGHVLSREDDLKLSEALKKNPVLLQRLLDDAAVEGLLKQLAVQREDFMRSFLERMRADQSANTFSRAVAQRLSKESRTRSVRRNRFAAWLPLAAAASVFLALGLWFLSSRPSLPGPAAVATVAEVHGSAYVIAENGRRTALRPGDSLHEGSRVQTAADARMRFSFLDATADIDLLASSKASFPLSSSSDRMTLEQGRLNAEVIRDPAGRNFTINTPQARVTVLGTRFGLYSGEARDLADMTRVDVEQGRIQLTLLETGETIDVPEGEYAFASRDLALKAYSHEDEWIEGPILFEGNFHEDMEEKWTVETLEYDRQKRRSRFIEEAPFVATPYVSVEPGAGRRPGAPAVSVRIPEGQNKSFYLKPVSGVTEFQALREHFDVKLMCLDSTLEIRLQDSVRPAIVFPLDGNPRADRALTRDWNRIRHDLVWRTDDQGERVLEMKHYINNRIYNWEWQYPRRVFFGINVTRGSVLLDNYVKRTLISADELMPE